MNWVNPFHAPAPGREQALARTVRFVGNMDLVLAGLALTVWVAVGSTPQATWHVVALGILAGTTLAFAVMAIAGWTHLDQATRTRDWYALAVGLATIAVVLVILAFYAAGLAAL